MLLKNGQKINGKEGFLKMPKTAIFEVSERYQKFDEKNKRQVRVNNYSTPAMYVKFSKEDNDNVEMRYAEVETPTPDGMGRTHKTYAPNKVTFVKGFLVVGTDKPDLYTWLMEHPKRGIKFNLKDAAVTAKGVVVNSELLFKAQALIYGDNAMKEHALRKVLFAKGHGGVDDMSFDEVKQQLDIMAKANPTDFINLCGSKQIDYKVLIRTAAQLKIISFDDANNRYNWGEKMGSSKGRQIVTVPAGLEDVITFFIDWLFRTDNSGVLNELQIAVEKFSTPEKKATKAATA